MRVRKKRRRSPVSINQSINQSIICVRDLGLISRIINLEISLSMALLVPVRIFLLEYNKYFELKTCGAPMERPKLELLASNSAHNLSCHITSL